MGLEPKAVGSMRCLTDEQRQNLTEDQKVQLRRTGVYAGDGIPVTRSRPAVMYALYQGSPFEYDRGTFAPIGPQFRLESNVDDLLAHPPFFDDTWIVACAPDGKMWPLWSWYKDRWMPVKTWSPKMSKEQGDEG